MTVSSSLTTQSAGSASRTACLGANVGVQVVAIAAAKSVANMQPPTPEGSEGEWGCAGAKSLRQRPPAERPPWTRVMRGMPRPLHPVHRAPQPDTREKHGHRDVNKCLVESAVSEFLCADVSGRPATALGGRGIRGF